MKTNRLILFVLALCFALPAGAVERWQLNCYGQRDACAVDCGQQIAGKYAKDYKRTSEEADADARALFSCQTNVCGSIFDACQQKADFNYDNLGKSQAEKDKNAIELFGCKKDELADGCCPGYKMSDFNMCCPVGAKAVFNSATGSVKCSDGKTEVSLSRVEVTLSKNNLKIDGKDFIDVSFKFVGKDAEGKEAPLGLFKNISLGGKVRTYDSGNAEYNVQLASLIDEKGNEAIGNTKFKFSPDNGTTGIDGVFKTRLSIDEADIRAVSGLKNINIRIKYGLGYDSKDPRTYKDFSLEISTPIKIESFVRGKQEAIYQGAWEFMTVKVKDDANQLKKYTIKAPQGKGTLRVGGKDLKDVGSDNNFIETRENTFKFEWNAPIISKVVKLDVAGEMAKAHMDAVSQAGIEGIVDYGVVPGLIKFNLPGGENTAKVIGQLVKGGAVAKDLHDLVGTGTLVDASERLGKSITEGEYQESILEFARAGIAGAAIVDGAIGIIAKPAEKVPVVKWFKKGVDWAKLPVKLALYDLAGYIKFTGLARDAVKSQIITVPFAIGVQVEAGGMRDLAFIDIPVSGEEILYQEEPAMAEKVDGIKEPSVPGYPATPNLER